MGFSATTWVEGKSERAREKERERERGREGEEGREGKREGGERERERESILDVPSSIKTKIRIKFRKCIVKKFFALVGILEKGQSRIF